MRKYLPATKANIAKCDNFREEYRAALRLPNGNKNAARITAHTNRKTRKEVHQVIFPWMLAAFFSI